MKIKGFRRELTHPGNCFWHLEFSGGYMWRYHISWMGWFATHKQQIFMSYYCKSCFSYDISGILNRWFFTFPVGIIRQLSALGRMDNLTDIVASQSASGPTQTLIPHQILKLPIKIPIFDTEDT